MQKQYYYTVLTEDMRREGIEYKENETYSGFTILSYKRLEETIHSNSEHSDRRFLIEVEYAKVYMTQREQEFYGVNEDNIKYNAYRTYKFKIIKELSSKDIVEELKDKKTYRAELLLAMYRSREELLENKDYYNKIIEEENRQYGRYYIGKNISMCLASNPNILEGFVYEISRSNVIKVLESLVENKTTPIKVVENICRFDSSLINIFRDKFTNREDITETLKKQIEIENTKKQKTNNKKTFLEKVCSIF